MLPGNIVMEMKLLSIFSQNPIIAHAFRSRRLNWQVMAALGLAFLAYCPACLIISPYALGSLFLEAGDFFFNNLAEAGNVTFRVTVIVVRTQLEM